MNTKNYLILTKKYKSLLSSIHSVFRVIDTTFDLTDLIVRITKLLNHIFKANSCTVALVAISKKKRMITTKCSITGNRRSLTTKRNKLKNKIENKIVATCSAIIKKNMIATPLMQEEVLGFIILKRNKKACRKDGFFDSFDLETLMTLAGQIVMAIRNIRLYQEQEKMVMGTIKSLVTLLDSKMPPPYTHTPHFLWLVKALAQELHMSKKEIDSLQYASLLHDAGKINIPLEILTKTSNLTGEEYDIVKRHPAKSAEIIKHLQILKPAVPIILHHHEKYDGSGYPSKLKKGQIPLGARVMAVADAFDAMVYGRPYRQRVSVDVAIEEIKKNCGSQFDPQIVKSLTKILHDKKLKKYLHLTH